MLRRPEIFSFLPAESNGKKGTTPAKNFWNTYKKLCFADCLVVSGVISNPLVTIVFNPNTSLEVRFKQHCFKREREEVQRLEGYCMYGRKKTIFPI